MEEKMNMIPESMYDEICFTLTEFENSTNDPDETGWLSDGEWLDVFYNLVCKIQDSIVQ